MFDLDNLDPELVLPNYEFRVRGKTYEHDLLAVGYRLRVLEGIEDPEKIREVVEEAFKLEDAKLSTYEACVILDDFRTFVQEKADGPLKKVFGRSLFSDTTTDSTPEKSEA